MGHKRKFLQIMHFNGPKKMCTSSFFALGEVFLSLSLSLSPARLSPFVLASEGGLEKKSGRFLASRKNILQRLSRLQARISRYTCKTGAPSAFSRAVANAICEN